MDLRMTHLKKKDVKAVILKFYELNASRAPISDFVPLLDIENFELGVEGTDIYFRGIAGFADHQMGKLVFFDQHFEIKSLRIIIKNQTAQVKTKVIWHARTWQSPAPYSELLRAVVIQTWRVIQSAETGLPIITSHIANQFYYLKGYAPKELLKKDFHLRIGKKKTRKPS
jgi:hypothetical protein